MQIFSLAAYLAILSVINANVLVVTETTVETVYANGSPVSTKAVSTPPAAPSVAVISVETPSAASSLALPELETKVFKVADPQVTSSAVVTKPTSSYAPTTLVAKSSPKQETTQEATSAKTSPTSTSSTAQATSSSSGSSSGDSDFASSILKAHNEKRSEHGVDSLSWDDTLASYAQNVADSYDCSGSLKHTGGKYGENLAVGYADGAKALEAWYDEGSNYDYSLASSFDHFTQVIWKSTTKLGCAQKDCSAENWGKYVICEYDPAGNVVGNGKANLLS